MSVASASMASSLSSLRSSISMVTLRKSMNQDATAVGNLIADMQQSNVRMAPTGANGSVGSIMDIRV